jgi:2-haloacid dehalogenase
MSGLFVFDAYGTLFDVHSAARRHAALIGPAAERLSELWRAKQLEYSWTRSLMGVHHDFQALTEEALDVAAAMVGGVAPAARAALLEAYATLSAYPEVPATLARLRASGARLAILSNGTPDMLARACGSAGLNAAFDAVLSIEAAGVFKTDPRAYRLATDRFGCAAQDVTFVSSNRWDVAGATAFGFSCLWINRSGAPDEYRDLRPRRVIASLAQIAT